MLMFCLWISAGMKFSLSPPTQGRECLHAVGVFAAASGRKLTAIVVKYADHVFRAEFQYNLPHGVQ